MHATVYQQIAKAVNEQGTREFTVPAIFAILQERGVKMNTSTPKATISTALGRMVKNGLVKIVFKGSGNTPNRYLRIPPEKMANDMLDEMDKEDLA